MPPQVERTAYSYIRFSTPGQLEGDSLRRQHEAAELYAATHGLKLDSSLRDLGRSAYAGDHRKGAMGAFLKAIEEGAVSSNAVILVEAIDRLSREFVIDAMSLLTTIINHGITVVTLEDGQEYSRDTLKEHPYLLQMLIAKMTQANSESKRKSVRVGAAWQNKKKEAAVTKKPISKVCPAWMRLSQDRTRYKLIEERAEIVRRIFAETIGGIGKDKIARRLNAEKIPTFAKSDQGVLDDRKSNGWHPSYIGKILNNRAVIGEFQPHFKNTATEKKQKPDGEAVQDYYPPVVTLNIWNAAHAATASRRGSGGRKADRIANLVSGICRCNRCGGKMVLINSGMRRRDARKPRVPDEERRGESLVCDSARRKLGCSETGRLRYLGIERALIAGLLLLDEGRGILPPAPVVEDADAMRKSALTDQIIQDQNRLDQLATNFTDITPVMNAMKIMAERISVAKAEYEALVKSQRETIVVDSDFWDAAREVVSTAAAGDLPTRARLQSVMRTIYETIFCAADNRTAYAFALGGRAGIQVSHDGSIQWIDIFQRNPDRTFRIDASGRFIGTVAAAPDADAAD